MGVADNRTYKNEYHFTDDSRPTSEQHPSIEKDPKVNTTIKDNPYRSNVEIEGGEIVLQPDLTALFKASGKRHSQGGMDVLLKPDSFVFSDFKDLKITEEEHEDFELKEGSTPAQTLKKNVDIKHYNTLVQNITNPYKDDLAKKSSAKMLEKYIKTLGNIAYIQENKKGFPQGLPDFSIGTAPIENEELEDKMDENKQYAKAGGIISGKPKMQLAGYSSRYGTDAWYPQQDKQRDYSTRGQYIPSAIQELVNQPTDYRYFKDTPYGWYGDPNKINYVPQKIEGPVNGQPQSNIVSQENISTPSPYLRGDRTAGKLPPYPKEWINYFDRSKGIQYNAPSWISPEQFYATPGLVDYMKTLDRTSGVDWDMGKADDGYWGWRHEAALRKFYPAKLVGETPTPNLLPRRTPSTSIPEGIASPSIDTPPVVPSIGNVPAGVKRADWKFTPWQKLSQAYNWAQWAGVNRYMPYRSRYNATYVDPALVNPEQAVGDMKGMTNQQLASLSTLSPILRNAQASGNFGQLLSQVAGVRSQYDNQNAQILNQARMYNNQVKNNESMVNMANDQQYYQQAIEGRKNFENMRTYTANQAMNNVLRDVETNQKLAYNLLTQNNPAWNFDWNTGRFTRTNKSIFDAQTDSKSDWYTQVAGTLMQRFQRGEQLSKTDVDFLKAILVKDFNPSSSSNPFAGLNLPNKKGGKIRNPYK